MLPRVPSVFPLARARRVLLALTTLGTLATAGCVGSIDNEEQFGPAPECRITLDVEDLFRQRCGTGTCHGNETADPAGELDLVSPNPGPRIVGTMSTQCEGRMRINPARPDDSFLLEKLEGPREGCGDRMPLVGFLDQAEIACVRDWVRQQARLAQMRDAGVPDMSAADLGTDDGGGT
ncbi:MAG: hypothetical protein KC593_04105 [Myxococcales bacterium]|nr:hypothetical protein [Myxococcales bacterium]MCB9629957.1 hypothetical protein [Sandaracinaceae bacterium]